MIGSLIRLLTGAQARWVGVAPVLEDGSIPTRIYFANHSSHLDAPVIWSSLPDPLRKRTRPVAGRDYWEKNAIRRYFAKHVFRAVLIERSKVTPSTNPLPAMEAALEHAQ